jgi:hypothetical protein
MSYLAFASLLLAALAIIIVAALASVGKDD